MRTLFATTALGLALVAGPVLAQSTTSSGNAGSLLSGSAGQTRPAAANGSLVDLDAGIDVDVGVGNGSNSQSTTTTTTTTNRKAYRGPAYQPRYLPYRGYRGQRGPVRPVYVHPDRGGRTTTTTTTTSSGRNGGVSVGANVPVDVTIGSGGAGQLGGVLNNGSRSAPRPEVVNPVRKPNAH